MNKSIPLSTKKGGTYKIWKDLKNIMLSKKSDTKKKPKKPKH